MSWQESKDLILGFLITTFTSWFILELREFRKSMNGEIHSLRDSVEKLHNKVIVVIERTSGHEKVLTEHTSRIVSLEKRKR